MKRASEENYQKRLEPNPISESARVGMFALGIKPIVRRRQSSPKIMRRTAARWASAGFVAGWRSEDRVPPFMTLVDNGAFVITLRSKRAFLCAGIFG